MARPPTQARCGLANSGATCYLNSLLQALYALEEVRLACKCDLGRLQGLATEKLGVDAGAYGFTSLQ